MPYIDPLRDPWDPYNYVTKQGRPRLPPAYFTHGYKMYQDQMANWMRELEDENNLYWQNMSKYNKKKLYKPIQYMGEYRIPIYYNYTDWLKKAKKYALRKRKIYLNKKRALTKRRALRK